MAAPEVTVIPAEAGIQARGSTIGLWLLDPGFRVVSRVIGGTDLV